jgi:hypothetical protein
MAETKVPAIKNIPSKLDGETKLALESIKEALEVRLGRRGDPKDRAVTLRELIDSGLATDLAKAPYNPNIAGATGFGPAIDEVGDVEVPPAPINLRAETLFKNIALKWHTSRAFNPPYGNHGFTEIWRSQNEDLSGTEIIGTSSGYSYVDASTEYNRTYYYWVRYVSNENVAGPWSNMASATTIEDIAATMAALSETLSNLPGYNLITTTAAAATVIKQSSEPSTRADSSAIGAYDIWFDTDDSQVYTRNAANNAWVAGRDATLTALYGSTSYTGSTITAAMATAQANIVTVTNAQSSTATSLTNLTAVANRTFRQDGIPTSIAIGDQWFDTNDSNKQYIAESVGADAITSGEWVLAADALVTGTGSSVTTLQTAVANIEGDTAAMYVIQVASESNGSKSAAGMVIGSNANSGSGAQSYVQFQADKFAIWSGSAAVAPFIIDSGVVYIDVVRIKDASILHAKIGSVNADTISTGTLDVANRIDAGDIHADKIESGTITATQIAGTTITGDKLVANTLTSTQINVDTLNVKHFDNVSTNIKSHLSGGDYVPLSIQANVQSWSGTYPGETIVSSETSSVVNISCTTANVRNSAKYRVVVSGVFGDVRNGTIQYSYDNFSSIAATLSPTMNANAGTYRTYVFIWDGQISGLSTSQSTVYWRINWDVTSGQVNSTYQALYVTIDNTQ